MAKKKRTKFIKVRNWLAIHAYNRSRAQGGPMGDAKKQRSKTLCRGKAEE